MKARALMTGFVLITLLLCYSTSMAQGGPPPGPGQSGPIDGGVVALVIGAAAYGYKRIRENKSKPTE